MSKRAPPQHTSHRQRRPGGAPPTGVRLERWHRYALYATLALVLASGLLWLLFHDFVRVTTSWGEGPHPLESWWLRLHGLAAMLTLVALGSLLLTHVVRAWRLGRNRASGGALAASLVLLIATGYALYYFGGEESRPAISLVHWVCGLVAVVLIAAHVALGRGLIVARRAGRPKANPARRSVRPAFDEGRLHSQALAPDAESAPRRASLPRGGGDH